MSISVKSLLLEEYIYFSEQSVDDLRLEIQQLLEKTSGWDFSVNLTGKFISDYCFELTPKWQSAWIKIIGFERDISHLNGDIYKDEHNRTCIKISVRPNYIFLIFFIASPLFGALFLTDKINKGISIEDAFTGFITIIVVPIVVLLYGHFEKQKIKNRFVKTFSLKRQS